jgi:hypothetical protein
MMPRVSLRRGRGIRNTGTEVASIRHMTDPRRKRRRPSTSPTIHPETRKPDERRPPGNEASRSSTRGTDARTGHDKDANEQQAESARNTPKRRR